jgi:anhydro-N-acetylmuramic acid kinase
MKELNVIGLNSGTSMDGVDAAVFRITPSLHIEMIGSLLYEYEPLFQRNLKKLIACGNATLDELCRLDSALAVVFSQAAKTLMHKLRLSRQNVDLIGSHGQTIWHAPKEQIFWGLPSRNTIQLGQPAIIAANTGIPVIADFRHADMAAGGQGAPLTPFADQVLFGHLKRNMGILNLGGIANITVLDEQGRAVLAYDTGPGNTLIDRAAAVMFGCNYDEDGQLAAKGKINKQWLEELKSAQPYFVLPPPKTTGRELFGNDYADQLCQQGKARGLSSSDILATIAALTAATVADSYNKFVAPRIHIEELILGGGGSCNQYLRHKLVEFWPHPLRLSDHEEYGVSSKFKESLLFALLAYTSYFGIPNNVPTCTGATRQICLGSLAQP